MWLSWESVWHSVGLTGNQYQVISISCNINLRIPFTQSEWRSLCVKVVLLLVTWWVPVMWGQTGCFLYGMQPETERDAPQQKVSPSPRDLDPPQVRGAHCPWSRWTCFVWSCALQAQRRVCMSVWQHSSGCTLTVRIKPHLLFFFVAPSILCFSC